jgi:hypothetical protein
MVYNVSDITFSENDTRRPVRSDESEQRDADYYRSNSIVSLTLEILNGCAYRCAGCFVNRKNKGGVSKSVIKDFRDLKESGILLDELALGPVSFLSASNTEEILRDSNFIELSEMFSTVEFNTAILPSDEEELDVDRILYLCSLTEVKFIDLELVIDPDLFMTDSNYVKDIQRWQDKILTDKRISTVYLANFTVNDSTSLFGLAEVTEKVNKTLNAEFRYNLSFLRSKSERIFHKNLKNFDSKNMGDIRYINNISSYDGMVNNHMTITYDKEKFYLSPVLNAPTNYTNKSLEFTLPNSGLAKKIESVTQYNYNNMVYDECNDCSNLPQCIETFRMNIMRDLNFKKCQWASYVR